MMNAGETAAEIVSIIDSEVECMNDVGKRILANRILELIKPWLPAEVKKAAPDASSIPMSDAEARDYGQKRSLDYGKYCGKQIDAIPLDYIIWLADESRYTWKDLSRYLNSDRIKLERQRLGI